MTKQLPATFMYERERFFAAGHANTPFGNEGDHGLRRKPDERDPKPNKDADKHPGIGPRPPFTAHVAPDFRLPSISAD